MRLFLKDVVHLLCIVRQSVVSVKHYCRHRPLIQIQNRRGCVLKKVHTTILRTSTIKIGRPLQVFELCCSYQINNTNIDPSLNPSSLIPAKTRKDSLLFLRYLPIIPRFAKQE